MKVIARPSVRLERVNWQDLSDRLVAHETLGPLLESLAGLVHGEADFCRGLLTALRHAPTVMELPLDTDAKAAVTGFLDAHKKKRLSRANDEFDSIARLASRFSIGSKVKNQQITPTSACSNNVVKEGTVQEETEGCTCKDSPQGHTRKDGDTAFTAPSEEPTLDEEPYMPWFPLRTHGSIRKRIFLLFDDSALSLLGRFVAILVMITILLSTVAFVMESMPEFREHPPECQRLKNAGLPLTIEACEPLPDDWLWSVEAACVAIFTIEYVVRILFVHAAREKGVNPIWATFRYAGRPLQIVDLCSVIPFYVEIIVGQGFNKFVYGKLLKLARILRLVKLGSKSPMIMMYWEVLIMSGQPLMVLMFFNFLIAVLFGSLIYFAEGLQYHVGPGWSDPAGLGPEALGTFPTGMYVRKPANWAKPDDEVELTPFRSIPYSLWWVCVTVTTVGYGDFSPTTPIGKVIGITCFYAGIILLALPISILGSNFNICYAQMMDRNELEHINLPPRPKSRFHRCLPCPYPSPNDEKDQFAMQAVQDRPTTADSRQSGGKFTALPCFPDVHGCRRKIFLLLEDPNASKLGRASSVLMMSTILVSTISFIVESMPDFRDTPPSCDLAKPSADECEPKPKEIFSHIELVCIIVFTVDYILRFAFVHAATPEDIGLMSPRKFSGCGITFYYARQFMNLIDLFAILPWYIQKMAGDLNAGGGFLRILRLVRIFRVLKMPKLRTCLDMFIEVGLDALPALVILLFMSLLACVFFASCIFFAETSNFSVEASVLEKFDKGMYMRPTFNGYGQEPSPFESIPYAFWWYFSTATTVGYGDDYPTTGMGRIIALFVFITGVILLAMPITVVGGSFNKYYDDWAKRFADEDGGLNGQSRDEASSLHDWDDKAAEVKMAWG